MTTTNESSVCGIYMMINGITGEQYVGQSINIIRRFNEHLRPKSRGTERLHKDVEMYGKEKFYLVILEECDCDELNEKEEYYIKFFKPEYNKSLGQGQKGIKLSDKTKNLISCARKREWENLSDIEKEKRINRLKEISRNRKRGYHLSEETRRKLSESHKGIKMSEETKKLKSEKMKQYYAKGNKPNLESHYRSIICTTTNERFKSIKLAAETYGIFESGISAVLRGKQKTTHGYQFVYIEKGV